MALAESTQTPQGYLLSLSRWRPIESAQLESPPSRIFAVALAPCASRMVARRRASGAWGASGNTT